MKNMRIAIKNIMKVIQEFLGKIVNLIVIIKIMVTIINNKILLQIHKGVIDSITQEITAVRLQQAIILSEIVGKPRSKTRKREER